MLLISLLLKRSLKEDAHYEDDEDIKQMEDAFCVFILSVVYCPNNLMTW